MRRLTLILLLAAGCSQHFGVRKTPEAEHYRQETTSALTTNRLSEPTRRFLVRSDLAGRFHTDSRGVLTALLDRLRSDRERIVAFHLAELTFHANQSSAPGSPRALNYHFSVAEFAYAYLFDPKLGPLPNPYDRKFRWACDLYNRSVSRVVSRLAPEWHEGETRRAFETIGGPIHFGQDLAAGSWNPSQFTTLLPTYELAVEGMDFVARSDGIGAPAIAVNADTGMGERSGKDRFLPPTQLSFAATVLFRFHGSIVDTREGQPPRSVTFELCDPYASETAELEGRTVPLELDLTTPLAYMLEQLPDYSGFKAMVKVEEWQPRTGLGMLQPYKPGRIPVVFVHGLMSSPTTWIRMLNDLLADRAIRERYQFWFFQYPTGNASIYSAAVLRHWLISAQEEFDPEYDDPAFQDMVVVGHSMGGLLTRFLIEEGGESLWDAITEKPFEEFKLDPEQRELVRTVFWFKPLPFVTRVVFASTPHRGSDFADATVGHIGANMIEVPPLLDSTAARILEQIPQSELQGIEHEQVNGISSLSPKNRILITVSSRPLPPGVHVHSLIGDEEGADRTGGTDGVVAYWSSHLDRVVSEKVVKSGHSTQQTLEGIAEIRRILRLHLEERPE